MERPYAHAEHYAAADHPRDRGADLKEVGGDLGSAVKSFKKAMSAAGELDETPSEPPKQLARDEEKQKQ